MDPSRTRADRRRVDPAVLQGAREASGDDPAAGGGAGRLLPHSTGNIWRRPLPRTRGGIRPRGQAQSGFLVRVRTRCAGRNGLLAARERRCAARGRADVRGCCAWSRLRRRLSVVVPVLGADGTVGRAPRAAAPAACCVRRRIPLRARSRFRRTVFVRRHRAPLYANRVAELRRSLAVCRKRGVHAHPSRFPRQRCGAATRRLAARCLSGSHSDQRGVSHRLYHEVRSLRVDSRVGRHRDPRMVGRGDGGVRRRVRRSRERRQKTARVSHHQPGRLHGLRRRARHRARAERRNRPRLRAHPLQGAALHGSGSRASGDRPAKAERHGRVVQDDARHSGALHGWCVRDFRSAALQRIRHQVDGRFSGG